MAEEQPGAQTTTRSKRRPFIIAVVILLAVIGLTLYNFYTNRPQNFVTLNGTIEATDVILSSKVNGRINAVNAQEGDSVTKGEVLVQIRQDEFRAALAQNQAALANARARLQEAIAGSRIQDIEQARAQVQQAQAAVAGAREALALANQDYQNVRDLQARLQTAQTNYNTTRAALQQAQQALRLVRQGPRTEEIQQAQANLQQAQATNARAQSDYRRAQTLLTRGAIPASELDAARAAAQTAQAQVAQAQARLNELKAGSRPEEIRQAEAAVSQAQAAFEGARESLTIARQQYVERTPQRTALANAQTNYNTSLAQLQQAQAHLQLLLAGTRPEQVQQFRAQVAQAQAAVSQAQTQLKDTTVISPIDGRVITRSVEPGESTTVGSTLMEVADLNTVWLRVYVEEPIYGRIKLGDEASVTVDSYPGQVFKGTITEINQQAEFTPKEIQTQEQRAKLVFGIKITIQNREGKLKPGMPADAVMKLAPIQQRSSSS